jgi:hypothetical protein
MTVDLRALVGKLNSTCRAALEGAAGLCLSRTHFDVDVEHLMVKLLEVPDGDLALVLRHYEIDVGRVTRSFMIGLERAKSGNQRTPAFAPGLLRLLSDAWLIASLDYADTSVRSGYVLLAVLRSDALAPNLSAIATDLATISEADLSRELVGIISRSTEAQAAVVGKVLLPFGNSIFISYRRDDTAGYARAIHRELSETFGPDSVFMDVESVEPGADFVDALDKALARCEVVVVLIGRGWHAPAHANDQGRTERDFVGMEVQAALARKMTLIPALIDGAMMPSETELPDELRGLLRHNALEIRHTTFQEDVERLADAIMKTLRRRAGTTRSAS